MFIEKHPNVKPAMDLCHIMSTFRWHETVTILQASASDLF